MKAIDDQSKSDSLKLNDTREEGMMALLSSFTRYCSSSDKRRACLQQQQHAQRESSCDSAKSDSKFVFSN